MVAAPTEAQTEPDTTDRAAACGASTIDRTQAGCLASAASDEDLLLPLAEAPPQLLRSPGAAPDWTQNTYDFYGSCLGGQNDGRPCAAEEDCPDGECAQESFTNSACLGGSNDGQACSFQGNCPDGACVVRICEGGTNEGNECTQEGDCPKGQCRVWDAAFDADVSFVGEVLDDPGCFPDLCEGLQERVFSPDERVNITATQTFPWRTIGRLTATWPVGGGTSCSGATFGRRHVLTSGHCIHTRRCRGGSNKGKDCSSGSDCPNSTCKKYWASSVSFSAGQRGATKPYGTQWAIRLRTFDAWIDSQNDNYDMAFVLLDSNIGNTVGWMGYETGSNNNKTRNMSGYPGDKPTGTQWFDHDPVTSETTHQMKYLIDSFSGQSGSPVWRYVESNGKRFIRGVHRCCKTGSFNQAVRINSGKFNAMEDFKSDYPRGFEPVGGNDCDTLGCDGVNIVLDCNGNGIPDRDDITRGGSTDSNGNTIPDECEGACCLPGGGCDSTQSALSCVARGGSFPADAPSACLGDANGDGIDDRCACPEILDSEPPNCAIDARYPHLPGADPTRFENRIGFRSVELSLSPSAHMRLISPTSFEMRFAGGPVPDPPVPVATELLDGTTVRVEFDRPLPPDRWSCLRLACGPSTSGAVCWGHHPADVNGDLSSNAPDILAIIDFLNGVLALDWYQCDVDASGDCNPADVLGVIDLLNGAGNFEAWNNRTNPGGACPSER